MITYNVHVGDDLQSVLNQAQPGDTVLIQAGAQFSGNFILSPKKGMPHILPPTLPGVPQPYHIIIRSDASDDQLPKAGCRVDPIIHPEDLSKLAKLISKTNNSTLQTTPPTTDAYTWAYWLIGIELTVDPNVVPIHDPNNGEDIAAYHIG